MSGTPPQVSRLKTITPIDGRYGGKTEKLQDYFSEHALIRERVLVEVDYFIALVEELDLDYIDPVHKAKLREIYTEFSEADSQEIKDTEKVTNHDVKAVEYFVKKRITELGLGTLSEFVHFGLTSQDINNTANPRMVKEAVEDIFIPEISKLGSELKKMAAKYSEIPMLAKTHGQAATPTNLGKEIMVFAERLNKEFRKLDDFKFEGKFGGATGNFNAHNVAYPNVNWIEFGNDFLQENLGLTRQQFTTQIEHYDNQSELFHIMIRINTILLDFCRDIWSYVSMAYFKQKMKEGEIGSSAMPHKVNPIDFENAEGNLGMANAMFGHLAEKLPISRLQRDLTDSTVCRNIGVPFSYTLIALKSIQKGISKLEADENKIKQNLIDNPMVIAEAIQNILRTVGFDKPYEALKDLTRGNNKITLEDIQKFITGLDINEDTRDRLLKITPLNYTGVFPPIQRESLVK